MKLELNVYLFLVLAFPFIVAFTPGPDAIYVIGDKESSRLAESDAYTHILLKEIKHELSAAVSEGYASSSGIDTVYFGGGTPSLLSNDNIESILKSIQGLIPMSSRPEITMEMDPGTFNADRLNQLKNLGVNRISMGVQSFDETLLRLAGRAHNLKDVYQAIDDVHRSSMDNFNIDLISSLPTSTLETWQHTLSEAVAAGCSHLSVYDLQIEELTAFGKWYTPGVYPMPSEDSSAAMYNAAVQTLTSAGFEHYEISNYARPDRRSRHNQKYWQQRPFFGFGMGATSYLKGLRASRPRTLPEYRTYVEELVDGDRKGTSRLLLASGQSDRDAMLDLVMLSLRTAEGLDVRRFEERYATAAPSLVQVLKKYETSGLVEECKSDKEWRIRLTDPKGFMVSNDIISSVFAAL